MLVEELDAPVFDTIIRQAGWHFIWIQGSCARKGFGGSRESATAHALTRALRGIDKRFNAAELDSVLVGSYFGLHAATVTLQPRQVQQDTSLG